MPALPVVPNVFKVNIDWLIGTDAEATVGLFVGWSGVTPTNAACISFANGVMSILASNMWHADTTLTQVIFRDLTTDEGAIGNSTTTAIVGTLTGDPVGAEVCALVNDRIGRTYRGGKPRQYWPWGGAGVLGSPQTWTDGFTTAIQDQANDLNDYLAGASYAGTDITGQVNVSYYKGNQALPIPSNPDRYKNHSLVRAAAVVDPITSLVASNTIASQRRRARRRR